MSDVKHRLSEQRCSNCNALLAKASLQNGKVVIKCKCGTVNTFEAATEKRTERRCNYPVFKGVLLIKEDKKSA